MQLLGLATVAFMATVGRSNVISTAERLQDIATQERGSSGSFETVAHDRVAGAGAGGSWEDGAGAEVMSAEAPLPAALFAAAMDADSAAKARAKKSLYPPLPAYPPAYSAYPPTPVYAPSYSTYKPPAVLPYPALPFCIEIRPKHYVTSPVIVCEAPQFPPAAYAAQPHYASYRAAEAANAASAPQPPPPPSAQRPPQSPAPGGPMVMPPPGGAVMVPPALPPRPPQTTGPGHDLPPLHPTHPSKDSFPSAQQPPHTQAKEACKEQGGKERTHYGPLERPYSPYAHGGHPPYAPAYSPAYVPAYTPAYAPGRPAAYPPAYPPAYSPPHSPSPYAVGLHVHPQPPPPPLALLQLYLKPNPHAPTPAPSPYAPAPYGHPAYRENEGSSKAVPNAAEHKEHSRGPEKLTVPLPTGEQHNPREVQGSSTLVGPAEHVTDARANEAAATALGA